MLTFRDIKTMIDNNEVDLDTSITINIDILDIILIHLFNIDEEDLNSDKSVEFLREINEDTYIDKENGYVSSHFIDIKIHTLKLTNAIDKYNEDEIDKYQLIKELSKLSNCIK